MDASTGDDHNSELESFREQWRREVQARNLRAQAPSLGQDDSTSASSSRPTRTSGPPRKGPKPTDKPVPPDSEHDYIAAPTFNEPAATPSVAGASSARQQDAGGSELVSALDHYEKAVEREAQGSLGDSLSLYRKAFRMDSRVDQIYKAKHFPAPKASKAAAPGSDSNAVAAGNADAVVLPMKELITSFAAAAIEPAPPPIEGMPQPRCHMAEMPDEILVHILRDIAVIDVGDFVRLAQVCKRLAYLVATEDRIWRRICLGTEFGFGGMHYEWQLGVLWDPPEDDGPEVMPDTGAGPTPAATAPLLLDDTPPFQLQLLSPQQRRQRRQEQDKAAATAALRLTSVYGSSWQRMFRLRPRIRFNGCYISTVNYMRAGQASAYTPTWGSSPVHIVTYYRYLRFFRDGSVVSLPTTAEPADVVHHLTRDLLLARDGAAPPAALAAATGLPSAVVQSALRGRWRLSSAADTPASDGPEPRPPPAEAEGDVFVETEGVGKYIYRMELSLRSAGKGAKHNKLAWRGFYSYNTLTDDWGEFMLKHDKPFFFSRVKSYGVGGEEMKNNPFSPSRIMGWQVRSR